MARAVVLASSLTALAVAPVRAQRAPEAVALSWRVPSDAGCATQDDIEREVARLTQVELASSARGRSLRILARATETNGTWFAQVTLADAQGWPLGVREVSAQSGSCRALDMPVALVVATLLDGLRTGSVDRAAVLTSDAHRFGMGGRVSAASGLGPQMWFGAGAEVELPLGIPIAVDVNGYIPGERVDAQGRGMRHWAAHGGVSACPRLFGNTVELRLCTGVQAGGVWGQSVGLTTSGSKLLPMLFVGVEPKLLLRLTPSWSLQLSLAAAWVPVRAHFLWLVADEERRWEGKPLALWARIGIIDFLR